MKPATVPKDRLVSIDELDDGIDDTIGDINELSNLINNPSAEGLLSAVKTFPNHSAPL